jgi:hypothetical protein
VKALGLVDDETFVVCWQRSLSLADAAAATQYPATRRGMGSCSMRASHLRRRGVRLKKFNSPKHIEKLKWLAKKALEAA